MADEQNLSILQIQIVATHTHTIRIIHKIHKILYVFYVCKHKIKYIQYIQLYTSVIT